MSKRSIAIGLLCLTLELFIVFLIRSQNTMTSKEDNINMTEEEFLLQLTTAENGAAIARSDRELWGDYPKKLFDLYVIAAKDDELTRALCARLMEDFYFYKSRASSAMQVSQLADEIQMKFQLLQIAQNRYRIELEQERK